MGNDKVSGVIIYENTEKYLPKVGRLLQYKKNLHFVGRVNSVKIDEKSGDVFVSFDVNSMDTKIENPLFKDEKSKEGKDYYNYEDFNDIEVFICNPSNIRKIEPYQAQIIDKNEYIVKKVHNDMYIFKKMYSTIDTEYSNLVEAILKGNFSEYDCSLSNQPYNNYFNMDNFSDWLLRTGAHTYVNNKGNKTLTLSREFRAYYEILYINTKDIYDSFGIPYTQEEIVTSCREKALEYIKTRYKRYLKTKSFDYTDFSLVTPQAHELNNTTEVVDDNQDNEDSEINED